MRGYLIPVGFDVLRYKRFYVDFSGGKDSLAALLWAYSNFQRDQITALYIEVTCNTHPWCTEYVKRVCSELNLPLIIDRQNACFYSCLRRWGIPLIAAQRWCLNHFKVKVLRRYADRPHVTGVTRSSVWRKSTQPVEYVRWSGNLTFNPILDWSREQIMDFIRDHGFQLNPCYERYGHSGNCMFCPYHQKHAIIMTLSDPFWRARIVPALRHVLAANRYGKMGYRLLRRWLDSTKQLTLDA